jgi:hypothetical protein
MIHSSFASQDDEYNDQATCSENVNEHMSLVLDEINLIEAVINTLETTIEKYVDDVRNIWDEVIVPFMESADCATMEYLQGSDCRKFMNFMTKQKTYCIMVGSHKRLMKKKAYLLSTINNKQ